MSLHREFIQTQLSELRLGASSGECFFKSSIQLVSEIERWEFWKSLLGDAVVLGEAPLSTFVRLIFINPIPCIVRGMAVISAERIVTGDGLTASDQQSSRLLLYRSGKPPVKRARQWLVAAAC